MTPRRLISFILSGYLCQLKLGMPLEDVISYLGQPDGYNSLSDFLDTLPNRKRLALNNVTQSFGLRYKGLEVIYDVVKDEITFIKLNLSNDFPVSFPQKLGLRGIKNMAGISLSGFLSFANKNNLIFCQHPATTKEGTVLFCPNSFVLVIFEMKLDEMKLYAIIKDGYRKEIPCTSKVK